MSQDFASVLQAYFPNMDVEVAGFLMTAALDAGALSMPLRIDPHAEIEFAPSEMLNLGQIRQRLNISATMSDQELLIALPELLMEDRLAQAPELSSAQKEIVRKMVRLV
jgi:hypothetical protein